MNLKKYLIIMSILTAFCWAIFGYVIFTVDPNQTNIVGFSMFYSSLFISLVGTAAIFGFLVRFVGLKKDLAFKSVKEAFRQSFLFSLLVVIGLYLLSKDLFTWLNLLYLIGGLSILEFFLLGYEKPGKN